MLASRAIWKVEFKSDHFVITTKKNKKIHSNVKLKSTIALKLFLVPPLNVPECLPFYFKNIRKETACRVTITMTMKGAVNNYIAGMTNLNVIKWTEAHMEQI